MRWWILSRSIQPLSAELCKSIQTDTKNKHTSRHTIGNWSRASFFFFFLLYLFFLNVLLHICFVDYHAEMKFEQLLKIICKRYFLFLLPLCPPARVFVRDRGQCGHCRQCKHGMRVLSRWLFFINIFGGLILVAGGLYFIFYLLSLCQNIFLENRRCVDAVPVTAVWKGTDLWAVICGAVVLLK